MPSLEVGGVPYQVGAVVIERDRVRPASPFEARCAADMVDGRAPRREVTLVEDHRQRTRPERAVVELVRWLELGGYKSVAIIQTPVDHDRPRAGASLLLKHAWASDGHGSCTMLPSWTRSVRTLRWRTLAADQPRLGTAANYAVMGATAISNTGPSVVNGNLAIRPGGSSSGPTSHRASQLEELRDSDHRHRAAGRGQRGRCRRVVRGVRL